MLPLGTANDFARSIGVPTDDLTHAMLIAAGDTARPVDIGIFDGKPFFNMATGGFGARVTAQTDPDLKKRLGGLAYLLTGVSRFGDLSGSRGRFRAEGLGFRLNLRALLKGGGFAHPAQETMHRRMHPGQLARPVVETAITAHPPAQQITQQQLPFLTEDLVAPRGLLPLASLEGVSLMAPPAPPMD